MVAPVQLLILGNLASAVSLTAKRPASHSNFHILVSRCAWRRLKKMIMKIGSY